MNENNCIIIIIIIVYIYYLTMLQFSVEKSIYKPLSHVIFDHTILLREKFIKHIVRH
jgi:hypothetical protein